MAMTGAQNGPIRSRQRRDLVELCVGYGLILVVLWTPRPAQRALFWLTAAFLVLVSVRPGADRRALGLSLAGLRPASPIALLALIVAGAAAIVARRVGTLHVPPSPGQFFVRYGGYCVWALAQQFLLQDFFLLRLRRLLPGRDAVAAGCAAGMFALAHVPSPILTCFTLVWGLVACMAFMRHRNLYPLALAHAVLGIGVAVTIPATATHNMRVGLGYLHYRAPGLTYRSRIDQTLSTSVWVIADAATLRSLRQARP